MLRSCALILALSLFACSSDEKKCELASSFSADATIDYGRALDLSARLCKATSAEGVSFEWSIDQEIVATSKDYRFLACPRFRGKTATVSVGLEKGSVGANQSWNIHVRDVEPDYENCTATMHPSDAIAAVQKGDFHGHDGISFREAVSCLDTALIQYPCDMKLAFWAAYAETMLFVQHSVTSLLVSGVSERTLNTLIDDQVDPLIERYRLLADEAPDDFTARPKNFDFRPLGVDQLVIRPGGDWDRGDFLFVDGALHLLKGGSKLLAAYVGSVNFIQMGALDAAALLLSGRGDAISKSLQNRLIQRLDTDANFLTLYPTEGEKRLEASREALIRGLTQVNEAIVFVKAETDDQRDDKFVYFDCGSDAICPPSHSRNSLTGDQGERLIKDEGTPGVYDFETDTYVDRNGNGRYDPPWGIVGADGDGTEADSQYSEGETIGTDAFDGMLGRIGLPIQPLAQQLLTELAANIKGPGALDLARFLQLSQSQVIQISLVGGINIPSLRLSRWYDGPRDLRDFLPLWSHSSQVFYTDTEEEPFEDTGLDRLPDSLEPVTTSTGCDKRPDALKNADPSGDNFDPQTNANDDCDNDGDGERDETDQAGRSTDLGTEGNGLFDWKDDNENLRHDSGEDSEIFSDIGITTFNESPVNAANGSWDVRDMAHNWPKGPDVGGRSVEMVRDPRNGTLQDGLSPLVDPVYYFFPDAQFNGVIIFDDRTVNADGVNLTDNAELMRFINKLVESRRGLLR